jgi:hypothetical protein
MSDMPRDPNATSDTSPVTITPEAMDTQLEPKRKVSPEASRALAEAQARRDARSDQPGQPERGGRPGPDPVRYGDWENGGIASDF